MDPTSDDRRHLANTLAHSDVVVNVASTIAIEAAMCDTPIVNIGFDGATRRPFLDSAARYYRYTHYRPLVEARAVRVAKSPEDMLELIRRYLERPDLDREGRAWATPVPSELGNAVAVSVRLPVLRLVKDVWV